MFLLEETRPDHERERSSASGQTCGFRIEEQGSSEIQILELFVSRKKVSGISGEAQDLREPHPSTLEIRRIRGLGLKGLSMGRGDHLASDQLLDRNAPSLPIGLLRFEDPVQSSSEFGEDLGFGRLFLLGQ